MSEIHLGGDTVGRLDGLRTEEESYDEPVDEPIDVYEVEELRPFHSGDGRSSADDRSRIRSHFPCSSR